MTTFRPNSEPSLSSMKATCTIEVRHSVQLDVIQSHEWPLNTYEAGAEGRGSYKVPEACVRLLPMSRNPAQRIADH